MERDWRLHAELDEPTWLGELLARQRAARLEHELEDALGSEVIATHDGATLFAYAHSRELIERVRGELEQLIAADERRASVDLSHWDESTRSWRDADAGAATAAPVPYDGPASETFVASIGRLANEDFERDVLERAAELGLRCEVARHPHLLTTQLAFTATGPPEALATLRSYVHDVAGMTIRADEAQLSPFGWWGVP